jgi:nicotinate-nucleotide pyrophosphorylase (carboxylating)
MDYGGFVVGETEETATLFGKSKGSSTVQLLNFQGVLAGVPFFDEVFSQLRCS